MGDSGAQGQGQQGGSAFNLDTTLSILFPLAGFAAGVVRPETAPAFNALSQQLARQDETERRRQEDEAERKAYPALFEAAQTGKFTGFDAAAVPATLRGPALNLMGEARRREQQEAERSTEATEARGFMADFAKARTSPMEALDIYNRVAERQPTTPAGLAAQQRVIEQLTPLVNRVQWMQSTAQQYAPKAPVVTPPAFDDMQTPVPPSTTREITPAVMAEMQRRAFLPQAQPGAPGFREEEAALGAPERPQDLADRLRAERSIAHYQRPAPTVEDFAKQAEAITRVLPEGFRAMPTISQTATGEMTASFAIREVPAQMTPEQTNHMAQLDEAFLSGKLNPAQYRAELFRLVGDATLARHLAEQMLMERNRSTQRAQEDEKFTRMLANDKFGQAARMISTTGSTVGNLRALLDNPVAFAQIPPRRQAQIVAEFLDLQDRQQRMVGAFLQSSAPEHLKSAFAGGGATPPPDAPAGTSSGAESGALPQSRRFMK